MGGCKKTADDPQREGTLRLSQYPAPKPDFRRASHAFALRSALGKGETWLRIFTSALFLFAAVSIAGKDNPRKLEAEINALMPPALRTKHFD